MKVYIYIGLALLYHSWYTSNFETTYKIPPFIKVAIFFWSSFSIKLSWFQRRNNKIDTILYDRYYLQNYKAITFEKLEIIQNIKNLIIQVIFIFSDWIVIKQIIVSSTHFYCWGKQIFKRMLPGGMSNFLLPRAW